MAYLSMSYFLSKKLLKSKTHVDLHQTEPVPPIPVTRTSKEKAFSLTKISGPEKKPGTEGWT